jgi:hypothetical protein
MAFIMTIGDIPLLVGATLEILVVHRALSTVRANTYIEGFF